MKKIASAALAALFSLALLAACSAAPASSTAPSSAPGAVSGAGLPAEAASASAPVFTSEPDAGEPQAGDEMRIAGLKGPTTMGMVKLMSDVDNGAARNSYQVSMSGTADEIVPGLASGTLDAAAIPANLASVLYNNLDGAVQVAAINTLGVLYVVETGEAVSSVADLRGKTVYSTGKGTTPEFALNYILQQNGVDPALDLDIQYKSEATEIAAMLGEGEDAVAVLPQPYVTAVQMQNEGVRVALNLTEEWDKVSADSSLVTGVLVVRRAFAEENPALLDEFLADYRASIEYVNGHVPEAAELVAQYGIVEKAPVAEKALPACNIVYIDGADMQRQLSGYLAVLHGQLPESVGGALPGDDFYYGAAAPAAA